jgi:hypothetical protein
VILDEYLREMIQDGVREKLCALGVSDASLSTVADPGYDEREEASGQPSHWGQRQAAR